MFVQTKLKKKETRKGLERKRVNVSVIIPRRAKGVSKGQGQGVE